MVDMVALLAAALIVGMVAARLIYLAGYRAGERTAVEGAAEKYFEEGYRVGFRAHTVVAGLPHRGVGSGPIVRHFGLDAAHSSPVDEAEFITREACNGD